MELGQQRGKGEDVCKELKRLMLAVFKKRMGQSYGKDKNKLSTIKKIPDLQLALPMCSGSNH